MKGKIEKRISELEDTLNTTLRFYDEDQENKYYSSRIMYLNGVINELKSLLEGEDEKSL